MSVAVGIAHPASPSPAGVERDVDQRGHDHAADRGGDRQRRAARVAQVTGDELALELQPGDEEEDRQQPVGGPLGQRQVQVQRRRPDPQVAERGVRVAPRRVRPDQREHGGRDQQDPADGLRTQDVADPADLRPAPPREQARSIERGAHALPPKAVDNRSADQASRHTTAHPTGRRPAGVARSGDGAHACGRAPDPRDESRRPLRWPQVSREVWSAPSQRAPIPNARSRTCPTCCPPIAACAIFLGAYVLIATEKGSPAPRPPWAAPR